ncbi:hypothetical protein [Methylobacterium oxalidis]|uniref:Uncharacterized protein n=1 Tax=Methylobacterium oxalidis TaxID=944322 RepID=A0A512J914_9HYPH|nr:hypothetical protein [Methylobacterium oxalidis]GEP06446.1 hypothetical protein MOX02_44840 [Methylobacterium oxalidis]GJE33528.1 hypothetical protein LDDCCGHA_3728 [Methylobacterium oxalidis]GLS65486.1 hypothetical protein GCM10007888_38680 [Methylobacterium oxalidis]
MIAAGAALVLASGLRKTAIGLLYLGTLAEPLLRASRWLEDRAREWNPRLWSRDEDPRNDIRERRP